MMHSTHHMRYFVIQIFLLYFELEHSDEVAMTQDPIEMETVGTDYGTVGTIQTESTYATLSYVPVTDMSLQTIQTEPPTTSLSYATVTMEPTAMTLATEPTEATLTYATVEPTAMTLETEPPTMATLSSTDLSWTTASTATSIGNTEGSGTLATATATLATETADPKTTESTAQTIGTGGVLVTKKPVSTTTTMSVEESKEIIFDKVPPKEQEKIVKEITVDPTMVKDYIPFLIGGYDEDVRKNLSYTTNETFLGAMYEDKSLDLERDFTEVYDKSLGTCYSFNNMNGSSVYNIRQPGTSGGLSVMLRVYPQEYLSWTVPSGFMVFVHDREEAVVSDSPRINSRSGSATNLIISKSLFTRLGGKYGMCASEISEVKSYYFPGKYTTDGCLRSCYQDASYEECGCYDPRYPSPEGAATCTLEQRQCLYEMMVGRGDPSQWTDCYCPLPCSNTDYKVSWSETILNKVPVECSYEGTTRPSGSPFDPTVAPITETPATIAEPTTTVGNPLGGGGPISSILSTLLPSPTTPYHEPTSTQMPTPELPVTIPVAVQASKCTDDDVYYYEQAKLSTLSLYPATLNETNRYAPVISKPTISPLKLFIINPVTNLSTPNSSSTIILSEKQDNTSETNRGNSTLIPSSFAVTSTDATMNGTVADDDWFDNKDNITIQSESRELFIGIPLSQVPKNKHVTGVCLVITLILLCIFVSCLDTQTCIIGKITRCCRKKKLRNAVAVPSKESDQKKLLKK
ncbi:hypothetical protein WR25_20191 [Diploscapter pachys]|uniref:Peptidase M12A domain-containing protein n=1 Tax=Diploscapter pachys TaxID=2018661 RepID=A0A2A2JTR8_9BILA|nr:hypothetical protein WR25_20191 [Diploscapter pachys]